MKTITVITDTVDPAPDTTVKSALSLPGIDTLLASGAAHIEFDEFKKNLQSVVDDLVAVIAQVRPNTSGAHIDSVRFSLAVSATGEIGLFSVAKGSMSGTTGLEFCIRFDK